MKRDVAMATGWGVGLGVTEEGRGGEAGCSSGGEGGHIR
jgi:hypothetical protein